MGAGQQALMRCLRRLLINPFGLSVLLLPLQLATRPGRESGLTLSISCGKLRGQMSGAGIPFVLPSATLLDKAAWLNLHRFIRVPEIHIAQWFQSLVFAAVFLASSTGATFAQARSADALDPAPSYYGAA